MHSVRLRNCFFLHLQLFIYQTVVQHLHPKRWMFCFVSGSRCFVCTCFQLCALWQRAIGETIGGLAWVGRAAVSVYHHSRPNLAKPPPFLWDHPLASCCSWMLFSFSLLPCSPRYKHNSSSLFAWTDVSLKAENVLNQELWNTNRVYSVVIVVLHWSLAVCNWIHLAKGHWTRLIRKWKRGTPALSYIIPVWTLYLCAVIHFKAASSASFSCCSVWRS